MFTLRRSRRWERRWNFSEANNIPALPYHGKMDLTPGARIRNAGCRTKFACWWARSPSVWHQQSCGARRDSSSHCRSRLSSITRKPAGRSRRPSRRLRSYSGAGAMRASRVFHRLAHRRGGKAARLAALSRDSGLRRIENLQASSDLAGTSARFRSGNRATACDACGSELAWSPRAEGREKRERPERARMSRGGAVRSVPLARQPAAEVDPACANICASGGRKQPSRAGMAAFIIMHDTSLDELCRVQPRTLANFARFRIRRTQDRALRNSKSSTP